MKVKILVEFEVPDAEEEHVAKSAASMAAYHHLCFCNYLGGKALEECEVHVDGYGPYNVRIGEDHE